MRRVHEYPANDVLELRLRRRLIPFVADVVVAVDLAGRAVQVREDFV